MNRLRKRGGSDAKENGKSKREKLKHEGRKNLSQLGSELLLELGGIGSKLADTLGQLLSGHGILVQLPAEGSLVEGDLGVLLGRRGSDLGAQLALEGLVRLLELLQEVGRDGQEIASGQLLNLANGTERGAHDDGLVAVLLVVVVDLGDGDNTGILSANVLLLVGGLVPVEDTADEGRDQSNLGLGASNSLYGLTNCKIMVSKNASYPSRQVSIKWNPEERSYLAEREEKGEVAVDTLNSLEVLGSLDTLPSGGDLDENALLGDAGILVKTDDLLGLGDGGLLVEGETGIDLGRDTAGDDLQDLDTKVDEELVQGRLGLGLEGTRWRQVGMRSLG